jgi:hypothetical protein
VGRGPCSQQGIKRWLATVRLIAGETDFLLEFYFGEEFMPTYKPGEKAPDSGELIEVGPRGGKVEGGRRTVIERGEKIPPTSEEGNQFKYRRGSKTTH